MVQGDPLLDHMFYQLRTACPMIGEAGFEEGRVRDPAAEYVGRYGFHGSLFGHSVLRSPPSTTFWGDKVLEGTPLNISAYYFGNQCLLPGSFDTNLTSFKDKQKVQLTVSGRIYNLDYIAQYGSCQPTTGVCQPFIKEEYT